MTRQRLKDTLGWGALLWLIGYLLGIALFAFVPANLIGWFIMPVGTLIALWIAFSKVHGDDFPYYAAVAVVWTVIAVVGDYLFIVKALKPADGYYKADVFLYYALTLLIPLVAGWRRSAQRPLSG